MLLLFNLSGVLQRVAASISSSSSINDSQAVLYSSPVCPVDSKPLDFIGVQSVELLLTPSGQFLVSVSARQGYIILFVYLADSAISQ